MIDWKAVVLAAQRSSAAYIEDAAKAQAAFEALGDKFIGMTSGVDYQAALTQDAAGATHLTISGTRAAQGDLVDVFDDADLIPAHLRVGTVTVGVNSGQVKLWNWVLKTADPKAVINVAGHSLGGARAQLALAYLPASRLGQIVSLAAPKYIQADFFKTYADELWRLTCVLNGADGWASWPWRNLLWDDRPPVDHVWLKDDNGGYVMIAGDKWPGGLVFADHDLSKYTSRLERIAQTQ